MKKLKYTDVNEELLDLLQFGCEQKLESDEYMKTWLKRISQIREKNVEDGISPADLKTLNTIWDQIGDSVSTYFNTQRLNQQLDAVARKQMESRNGKYLGSTAAEFRNATKREQSKSISDAEVAAMPINYSDEELLTIADHLLNRRELGRKAELMFS